MDIRVECSCGQAYEFPVEPVNNAMPCAVACPACGADGTEIANAFIRQSGINTAPVAYSAPMPASMATEAPEPAAPARAPGLRINRHEASAPPAPLPTPAPLPRMPAVAPKQVKRSPMANITGEANPAMAILGGVVAGVIGAFAWYLISKATDMHIGYMAVGVGALTGFGVKMAGGGSTNFGVVAAICAALAILGGEFLFINSILNKELANRGLHIAAEMMTFGDRLKVFQKVALEDGFMILWLLLGVASGYRIASK